MRQARFHLFLVAVIFAALGFSIGILSFLAKRLFDLEPPKLLRTITNYVSGVKLYNQICRRGEGSFSGDEEFLDNIGAPPRVSVRSRMFRTIANVACSGYDKWFVLAHSLGSVVAFNGLMETSWAWPGYLTEKQWLALKDQQPPMAGPPNPGWLRPTGDSSPPRPSWSSDEVAYRRQIFSKFAGMMTYGSPLGKFAAIWPARVPISKVPAFSSDAVWVNLFDPIDPISGALNSFPVLPPGWCPRLTSIGYKTSPILLLAHLKYLTSSIKAGSRGSNDLVSAVASWIIGIADAPGTGNNVLGNNQFDAKSTVYKIRYSAAIVSWVAAFMMIILIGAFFFPLFIHTLSSSVAELFQHAKSLFVSHRGATQ